MRLIWNLTIILMVSATDLAKPAVAGFGYADLIALASSGEASNMDAFIALLPAELRSSFTLMYASKSSQHASFERPRAILFSPDGKLMLSFNGDSSHRGYNSLEVIHLEDRSKQFKFTEITFGESVKVHENPKSCTACHGVPPRPKWDPYSEWPGAYGSSDDFRYKNTNLHNSELSNLKKFDSKRLGQERYRHLLPQGDGLLNHFREFRPNTELTMAVSMANAERMNQMILEMPEYNRHRYAIVAALLDADGIATYLPVTDRIRNRPYLLYRHDTLRSHKEVIRGVVDRHRKNGAYFNGELMFGFMRKDYEEPNRIAKLRYVIEGSMGKSMKNWATTFSPSYVFEDGGGALDHLLKLQLAELAKSDPDLRLNPEMLENYRVFRSRQLHGYSSPKEEIWKRERRRFLSELRSRGKGSVVLRLISCVRNALQK